MSGAEMIVDEQLAIIEKAAMAFVHGHWDQLDDFIQEGALSLLMHPYDPASGVSQCRYIAWRTRTAAINELRRHTKWSRKDRHAKLLGFLPNDFDYHRSAATQDDDCAAAFVHPRLRAALLSLSEKDRFVIIRYYFRNVSMDEIARMLGVTQPRASHRHARALKRLRAALTNLESSSS